VAERVSALAKPVAVEVRTVKRTLSLTAIVSIIFFTVSGGPYGLEDVMGESGPGMAVLLILFTPLIWFFVTFGAIIQLWFDSFHETTSVD
jgi:hypothetical protein